MGENYFRVKVFCFLNIIITSFIVFFIFFGVSLEIIVMLHLS